MRANRRANASFRSLEELDPRNLALQGLRSSRLASRTCATGAIEPAGAVPGAESQILAERCMCSGRSGVVPPVASHGYWRMPFSTL